LSDEEWTVLAPLLQRSHPAGRRQTYPLRRIIDATFDLLRTGAQWRLLPHKYPPRCAVFYHYAQWREDGTWGAEQELLLLTRLDRTERQPFGQGLHTHHST
jgi:putative transposase